MLETLVPSKIRRTLLEHLLAHPNERFYLRGLAKTLELSLSPLRRELVRLEQLGLLKTYDEANIRFYVVNHESPLFLQLQQAASSGPQIPPGEHGAGHESTGALAPDAASREAQPAQPVELTASSTVLSHRTIERIRRAAAPAIRWVEVLKAVAVMFVAALLLGGIGYLVVANRQLMAQFNRTLVSASRAVPPRESSPAASGEMRSSRWRLVPGAIGGGFVSDAARNPERYSK